MNPGMHPESQAPLHLGRFSSEGRAARAHDVAVLTLHGPNGCRSLNFPADAYAAQGFGELAGVSPEAVVDALRAEAAAPALRPTR